MKLLSYHLYGFIMLSPIHLTVCLSVVGNARAPYSGSCSFRQNFCAIWFIGHPLTFTKIFYRDRPSGTPPLGELNTTWVAKYSDFEPIKGYILETVQDRR